MSWQQTHRQWGNQRTLRGVAHYMRDGTALCGYTPMPGVTEMVWVDEAEQVPHCMQCLKLRDRELIA